MADDDRTIITRLVIEAAEAIANLENFDARLEETKKQLSSIATQTGKSFGEIGEELKKAFEGTDLQPLIQQLEQAGQSVEEFKNIVDQATRIRMFEGGVDDLQAMDIALQERRAVLNSLKQSMLDLAKTSDDSFELINKSVKEIRLERLKQEIENVSDIIDDLYGKLGELEKEKISRSTFEQLAFQTPEELGIKGVTIDEEIQQSLRDAALVMGDIQREAQLVKELAPTALREVSQEAKNLGTSIEATLTPLQQLVQDGREAKQAFAEGEIKQLDVVGDEEVQQLAQLAAELGSVEEALAQMKPDLQIDDALREQLQNVDADIRSTAQNLSEQINDVRFDQIQDEAKRLETVLRERAEKSGQAYADLAKQMKETFAAETTAKFGGMTEGAKAEIEEYNLAVDQALKNIKQQTAQATAAQREWEQATKQGLSQMSAQATAYGQSVGKTSQIIQQTAQRNGQSWQQVAQRMVQLGVPINLVNNAMKQLGQTAQQVANTIKNTAQATGQTWQQVANQLQAIGVPLNTIRQAMQQLGAQLQQVNTQVQQTQTGFQGFINSLGSLGNVVQYVIGGSLAFVAVRVLREVSRYLQEATKAAIEFTQVTFQLQIAIRGLQRSGVETTFKEFSQFIRDIRNEFPIFSRQDITEAVSIAALMTREFGFTADQIQEVVRVSTLMSIVTGKDLTEAVRGVTYAVGAGYFEALQRVGVNISRATIAQEAMRRGLQGSYNDLDQTTRAALTLEVVLENLAALEEDAADISEVTAGKTRELSAAWEDFTLLIGQRTLPLLDELIEVLTIDLRKAIDFFSTTPGVLPPDEIEKSIQALRDFGFSEEFVASQAKFLYEQWEKFGDKLDEIDGKDVDIEVNVKVNYDGMEFTAEEIENISKATQQLGEEITEIELEAEADRIDTINEYLDDKEEMQEEHNRRLEDIEADHQDRMDDIDEKAAQRRADEIADYEFKVAEEIRSSAFRKEEAERKYRERELREERKFQEKLRQLRENFLLDLEDAVRDRDARQIIRLTRQYNLRRDQMVREEKINKEDRQAAFEEELRQIEFQRKERLRQLYLEHQQRIEEINLQAKREAAQEQIEYERKQAAEDERYTDAQNKRSDRLNEQLNDINAAAADRIAAIIIGLQEEYNLTEDQLKLVLSLWEDYHGPDGRINQAVNDGVTAAINRMNQLAAYALQLRALLATAFPSTNPNDMNPLRKDWQSDFENAGPQAKGGTIIAREPTVALFGEAGPEMATFTPLNKLSDASMPGTQMFSSRDSQTGRISLEMLLSPDLEARIIDNTLNEVADVVYRIERERR